MSSVSGYKRARSDYLNENEPIKQKFTFKEKRIHIETPLDVLSSAASSTEVHPASAGAASASSTEVDPASAGAASALSHIVPPATGGAGTASIAASASAIASSASQTIDFDVYLDDYTYCMRSMTNFLIYTDYCLTDCKNYISDAYKNCTKKSITEINVGILFIRNRLESMNHCYMDMKMLFERFAKFAPGQKVSNLYVQVPTSTKKLAFSVSFTTFQSKVEKLMNFIYYSLIVLDSLLEKINFKVEKSIPTSRLLFTYQFILWECTSINNQLCDMSSDYRTLFK
jgi:hypothetical protein